MVTRASANFNMTRVQRPAAIRTDEIDAVLLDLDGVLTKTAVLHATAWKQVFDDYLSERTGSGAEPSRPFDIEADYRKYVDGKPRYEGVESFLRSRGISLPYGQPDDPPDRLTVCGLGNRKNEVYRQRLKEGAVEVYETSLDFVRRAKAQELRVAVVSSSKNCTAVLEATGLTGLFDAIVDGVEIARLGLRGKPAPDMYLEAAKRLGVEPGRAAVVEDALSGVKAAHAGGVGLVIGIDRAGRPRGLIESGADIVVSDLKDVSFDPEQALLGSPIDEVPSALSSLDEIGERLKGRRIAVFLDYDGTLVPIVERPELAVMPEEMRATVRELAKRCPVAIISGRDREALQRLVKLPSLTYVGSHGFDIVGPDGERIRHAEAAKYLPAVRAAQGDLEERLRGIKGALVEAKYFSVAVHYRLVNEKYVMSVWEAVDAVASRHPELRIMAGKKVVELLPRIDWDKGKALRWLLDALHLERPNVVPLYLGDDRTDEDAFEALQGVGLGLVVGHGMRPTIAHYRLEDPNEVAEFLRALISMIEASA